MFNFIKKHLLIFFFIIFFLVILEISIERKKLNTLTNSPLNNNIISTSINNVNEMIDTIKNSAKFIDDEVVITNGVPIITAYNKPSFDLSIKSVDGTKINVYRNLSLTNSLSINERRASGSILLFEGFNGIKFRIADNFGNESEDKATVFITLDTLPPKIYTSCLVNAGKPILLTDFNSEWVCVNIGEASGPLYGKALFPIYGSTSSSSIKAYINGKQLTASINDNYINEKINLPVSLGTNIYEITAKDALGNESKERKDFIWEDKDTQSNYDSNDINNSIGCCKICSTGKACGDSCISRSYTCHKAPGCACDSY